MNYWGLSVEVKQLYKLGKWHKVPFEYVSRDYMEEREKWCYNYSSEGCFSTGEQAYWFSNEQDALMFMLRWGSA